MRLVRALALAAVALCSTAATAPPATGEASSEATTGAGGTQARVAKAGSQTKPAKKKVWTNADLVALRKDPSAQVMVLESKRIGGPTAQVRSKPAVRPQDVVDRYALLAKEAEQKVAELQRERLAASNPYLRGLASGTGGPRTPDEIEADLKRWAGRRDAAKANLERATKLTGAKPKAPDQR